MSKRSQLVFGWSQDGKWRGAAPGEIRSGTLIGTGGLESQAIFNNTQWKSVSRSGAGDGWAAVRHFNLHALHALLNSDLDPGLDFKFAVTAMLSLRLNAGTQCQGSMGFIGYLDPTDPATAVGVGIIGNADGNWRGYIADTIDGGASARVHQDLDLGVPTSGVHIVSFVIDARVAEVEFFADGASKGNIQTLSFTLDELAGNPEFVYGIQADDQGQLFIHCADQQHVVIETSEPSVLVPSNRITYQRVLNMARSRSPQFKDLLLDDQQIFDELNAITLELISEGSDADITTFQEVVQWSVDVAPTLSPVPTDARDVTQFLLPNWVNSVYAMEAIKADGSKVEITVAKKESQIRDRPLLDESGFLVDLQEPGVRKPRVYKVWDGATSNWIYAKDTDNVAPGNDPWQNVTDVQWVVSGVRLPATTRDDLTMVMAVPYQAMVPLVEAYAIILGGRAGKEIQWMRDQREVKEAAFTRFREWVQMLDLATDEPFDPEIGMP